MIQIRSAARVRLVMRNGEGVSLDNDSSDAGRSDEDDDDAEDGDDRKRGRCMEI